MTISVHDNKLISYTVNENAKTILLETVFADKSPHEYTNVIFSEVLAYFFENHSLQLGTIIFNIEESATDSILEANWKKFQDGKKHGWPGDWADSQEKAKIYFKNNDIKAYEISSSCGLCGWVLAKSMEIR